jgi:ActR/RegA family two-component response regulator
MTDKVFILEDDELYAGRIRRKLENLGREVEISGDVETAREIFDSNGDTYSVYCLDMQNPLRPGGSNRMGGMVFGRYLVDNEVDADKIYIMSGAELERENIANVLGIDEGHILLKPVNWNELLD